MWAIGLPTGSASPPPERARKAGKCSPSPTYPGAAANVGFDVDRVTSRNVKPAVAVAAIGADIKIGVQSDFPDWSQPLSPIFRTDLVAHYL
jgi:hypothetical protein